MAAMLGMDASAFQMPKFDPNSVAQAADQTDAELVSLYVRMWMPSQLNAHTFNLSFCGTAFLVESCSAQLYSSVHAVLAGTVHSVHCHPHLLLTFSFFLFLDF